MDFTNATRHLGQCLFISLSQVPNPNPRKAGRGGKMPEEERSSREDGQAAWKMAAIAGVIGNEANLMCCL